MKLLQTGTINFSRPPISQFYNDNEEYTVTKGRFIYKDSIASKIDAVDTIIDACCFDKMIYLVTKNNGLMKFDFHKKSVEQIKLNINACVISYIQKTKSIVVGTVEGKIVILNEQVKPIKNIYLLKDPVTNLNVDLKNMIVSTCVNSSILYVINTKTMEKHSIELDRGVITSFDLINKRFAVVGTTEGYVMYVSLEYQKVISTLRVPHPVSSVKSFSSGAFVGTTGGRLYYCEVKEDSFEVLLEKDVYGVVNRINIQNDKMAVFCGREELQGAFYKNKKWKNVVVKYQIK